MPYTIDSLPKAKRGGTGRKKVYDFTPYFDGNVHVFTRGTKDEVKAGEKDYSSKDVSFSQLIRTAAEEVNMVATVITVEDGVAMQAEPLTDEHLKARAERAAKRKATMEANAANGDSAADATLSDSGDDETLELDDDDDDDEEDSDDEEW
jgi:paraquat-inducible protein B